MQDQSKVTVDSLNKLMVSEIVLKGAEPLGDGSYKVSLNLLESGENLSSVLQPSGTSTDQGENMIWKFVNWLLIYILLTGRGGWFMCSVCFEESCVCTLVYNRDPICW